MTEEIQQEKDPEIIDSLYETLHKDDVGVARESLEQLHPSEIADALEGLPAKEREMLWELVPPEVEGDVISELQGSIRTELLEQMQPIEVVEVTKGLDTDDVADIIQELPDDLKDTVLLTMDEQRRQHLASVLSFPEDTAGGLMNIDIVSVRADVTLDVVIRYLRQLKNIPEQTDSLMVVDRENKYLGRLSLSDLLSNDPETSVGELMRESDGIPAMTPANEVAKIFEQRDLVSAAVINDDNILLGRITVDDVVDVIQEAAEQSMKNMAGVGFDEMFAPVLTSARRRTIWLGINLATAFLAAWVIGQFEDTIEQLVALAILMPIVAGMGGIAGSQTLTIAIRGIATGQLGKTTSRALMLKEGLVGVLNGSVWAVVVTVIVVLWFKNWPLGLVIGAAMVINLIVAALAGAVIPLALKRFGIDPAIAGSVLLTTVTDVVGFVSFLGLATLLLLS
ncbi:MAG: magnesium transporter [Gammaproteobacteria bacterium]